MIQFEVNGVRYIGVEVPDNVSEFGIEDSTLIRLDGAGWSDLPFAISLPAGNYEIVGMVGRLTGKELVNVLPQYDFMTCPISDIENYLTELQKITQLPKNTLILKTTDNE